MPLSPLIFPVIVLSGSASRWMITGLAFPQIGAIQFADARHDLQFGEVQHVGHRHSGLNLVAFANIGHLRSGEEETAPLSAGWPPVRSSARAVSPDGGAAFRAPFRASALFFSSRRTCDFRFGLPPPAT